MRISDWSSDVCSSDLRAVERDHAILGGELDDLIREAGAIAQPGEFRRFGGGFQCFTAPHKLAFGRHAARDDVGDVAQRPDQRAVVGGDGAVIIGTRAAIRSEEHTSELQSLLRISYAVFCLQKKKT